jgi:hypothetical protein
MPENVRLVALLLCFASMAYGIYWAIDNALSEALDEASIRGIYTEANNLVKDPQGTQTFLKKRLDANYLRTGSLIRVASGRPNETIPVSQNKTQMIETALQESSVTTIKQYDRKIIDVKFSDDQQYAYVSSTETSSGVLNLPIPDNKKIAVQFNTGGACVDTLTLVKAVISLVRSNCTHKIALLQ